MGSLFTGVGGLDLGMEWAGLGPVIWQVEIDPWRRSILAKHWPNADRSVVDVRDAGAATLPPVGVVALGFPCQDLSLAGRGAGLEGERSGLVWEALRAIDELKPDALCIENGALSWRRWLCPVRTAMHERGYRTRALRISAADVGAPHGRPRIFVLAHRDQERRGAGLVRSREERQARGEPVQGRAGEAGWNDVAAAEPRVGGRADGLPARVVRWPAGQGRPPNPWEPPRTAARVMGRGRQIAAIGDAVVPAAAFVAGCELAAWIGRPALKAHEGRR